MLPIPAANHATGSFQGEPEHGLSGPTSAVVLIIRVCAVSRGLELLLRSDRSP
jgi:hypothetical protein